VEPIAIGGADIERSGQVEPTAVGGAGTVTAGRHRMRKGGGGNRVGISTHSPEANACQHPSGRGELADAEENWSEAQGSQGSWLMKIGQRLRGARGAGRCRGRLVRGSGEPGELPGLSAPQVCCWCDSQQHSCYWWAVLAEMDPDYLRLDRGEKPCMVSDPLAESGHQQRYNFFRGESV